MNKNVSCAVSFVLGAAVGVVASWNYAQKKYEKISQEEIESVKEAFGNRLDEIMIKTEQVVSKYEGPEDADEAKEHEGVQVPAHVDTDILSRADYERPPFVDYHAISTKTAPTVEVPKAILGERPYVIAPDDFGEMGDYQTITLTCYKDNILADDNDELIDDIDDVIGLDSLNHFGEYEEDVVHVRNDMRKCDYEICRDYRSYYEVTGISPD